MIDIDELAALANAATPGPWTAGSRCVRDSDGHGVAGEGYTTEDADLAYIAAANPETVLALIERLRAAEELAMANRGDYLRAHALLCDLHQRFSKALTPGTRPTDWDTLVAAAERHGVQP